MNEKGTGVFCHCGGMIVERSFIPYIPKTSSKVYGRGSNNIATEGDRKIDGYHCEHCGIEYHKLPTSQHENK